MCVRVRARAIIIEIIIDFQTDRIPVERTSGLKLSQPKPAKKLKEPVDKEEVPPPPKEQAIGNYTLSCVEAESV